jgi:large subunit ribosomal protein L25
MKSVSLTAYPRSKTRRVGAKQLRSAGRIPAVIYGRQVAPQNLEVVQHEIEDLIHNASAENLLLDLAVNEDARPKRLALVQEIQHHPLNGRILHIDLHEVKEDEQVTITVPVEATGEAIGVKNGGVLEHVRFSLRVRALPRDLPEALLVDVTHLEIGKAVHLGEIKPPAGVQILGDKNISVLAVAAPLTEEQEKALEAAAAAASGEVEMIKEKKEEGEGAEGAKPTAGAAAGKAAPAAAGKADAKAPAAAEKAPAEKKK